MSAMKTEKGSWWNRFVAEYATKELLLRAPGTRFGFLACHSTEKLVQLVGGFWRNSRSVRTGMRTPVNRLHVPKTAVRYPAEIQGIDVARA
eukprot:342686-Prymnesium_polylepis.1